MAYTTTTLVKQLIGTLYDSTNDVADARLTVIIAECDRSIDAGLRRVCYVPFNATGATPATPDIIGRIAQHMAAAQALKEIGARDANSALIEVARVWQSDAESWIADIIADDGHFDHESTTGEALTFGSGTNDWNLDTDEAQLASTTPCDSGYPPGILRHTVVFENSGYTTLRNGVDYRVKWDNRRNIFILHALRSEIYDGTISNPSVAYKWDYRRHHAFGPTRTVLLNG